MEVYAADDPALVRDAAMKAEKAIQAASCCVSVAKQVAQASGNPINTDGESGLEEVKSGGPEVRLLELKPALSAWAKADQKELKRILERVLAA